MHNNQCTKDRSSGMCPAEGYIIELDVLAYKNIKRRPDLLNRACSYKELRIPQFNTT
jgi:hypothetical protein